MKKLVDAEKLMELVNADAAELAKELPYRDHAPYVLAALRLQGIIDHALYVLAALRLQWIIDHELPEAVIRCKDCKYYNRSMLIHSRCGCTRQGESSGMVRCTDDDFCSYGEKKNDEIGRICEKK